MQDRFSYSKINTFISCPQKYKIKYIDKVSTKSQGIESFMGIIVHMVIYDISKEKFNKSLDSILEHYDRTWERMWHNQIMSVIPREYLSKIDNNAYRKKSKDRYFLIGKECIVRFVKSKLYTDLINNKPWDNIGRKINTLLEERVEFKINDINYVGVMDRVDFFENGAIIYDYKTNKRLQTINQLKKNIQFYIYYHAVNQMIDSMDENKISISIYNLIHNKIDYFSYSSDDIIRMNENLDKIIYNLTSSTEFRPKESPLCNWCYYWKECSIKLVDNPSAISL